MLSGEQCTHHQPRVQALGDARALPLQRTPARSSAPAHAPAPVTTSARCARAPRTSPDACTCTSGRSLMTACLPVLVRPRLPAPTPTYTLDRALELPAAPLPACAHPATRQACPSVLPLHPTSFQELNRVTRLSNTSSTLSLYLEARFSHNRERSKELVNTDYRLRWLVLRCFPFLKINFQVKGTGYLFGCMFIYIVRTRMWTLVGAYMRAFGLRGLGVSTFPWGRVTDTRERRSRHLSFYDSKVEGG
ncbi:hypothetical protein CRG98_017984 [Punica granatum]|uniref:Uncharacterized protein n=1 Tax=Punica granatum TaxID=22663 RepID=A0A2I0JZ54_PUNGR|nr:hypothetical protein CRG98_017984 [Punica granatum]